MFTRYNELRANFEAAIEKLPDYKRGNAWEFVKALEARCEAFHSDPLTQAAPELLAALRDVVSLLPVRDPAYAAVLAAIAKAEAPDVR